MALTIEDLEARQDEIRGRLAQIDQEFAGKVMPEEVRFEWNDLGKELKEDNAKLLDELRARRAFLQGVESDESRQESGAQFHTAHPGRSGAGKGPNWDVYDIRSNSRGPEDEAKQLRDNAMRALDEATFPHPDADQARTKERIQGLLERFSDNDDGGDQWLARRLLTTGSPVYKRAFAKTLAGRPLSPDEMRAMSLTGASGGFAVPYQLDASIVGTSNSSVNPYRAIARVETITTNEWRGVTSGAITAAYAAEGTEASDNSPTLAQPSCIPERCQAFVPMSMEVAGDWGSIQQELATLIQEGKDDVEATKFTSGAGHGSNEPQGLLTGATGTVAAGTAAFAIAHLYALQNALAPRFQPRAQFVGNRATYSLVKQFDTSGGGMFWGDLRSGFTSAVPTPGNLGATLNGYPTNECSAYTSALTAGSKILTLGDFRYMVIVDRLGMSIELISHLFGASGRPTGQRGLFAIWRNSSVILSTAAFKTLQTT